MSVDHILPPWIARIPPEHHKILKTHRILIIFFIFYGELCRLQELHKKNLRGFINFMSTGFSKIAKTHVALGTLSLYSD